MFTLDSEKGTEVVEGIEASLRLLKILFKITYDSDIRVVALRLLNSINEFASDTMNERENGED